MSLHVIFMAGKKNKNTSRPVAFKKLERENIPLGAARIEITLGEIPLGEVRLDQENPRLRYLIAAMNVSAMTQAELEKLLWQDPAVKDLKRSILLNGGLIDAIIVTHDGIVIEGNCRVAAYHKLSTEYPEDERWSRMRARILPRGITREQLDVLLGELHIAGKNNWSPFEQAAHLYKMNQKGYSEGWLAESYRQSKLSISNKIRAYRLMTERFLNRYPDPTNVMKWSYFEEFYKRCKPAANTLEGDDLESDFVTWVGDGKFTKGAQVRDLPRILESSTARRALSERGFDAAWEIVKLNNPEIDSPTFRAISRALDALTSFPLSELKAIRDGNQRKTKRLNDLKKAIEQILEQSGRSSKETNRARSTRRA